MQEISELKIQRAEASIKAVLQSQSIELIKYFYEKFPKQQQVQPNQAELYKSERLIETYSFTFSKKIVNAAYRKALKGKHKAPIFQCIMDYVDEEVINRARLNRQKSILEHTKPVAFRQ